MAVIAGAGPEAAGEGGVLIGVGVGPGDPELMTLKARRVIGSAKVIAYPAPDGRESRARRIAADCVAPDAEEIAFPLPMRVAPEAGRRAYDAAAARIAAHLAAGRDVAALCEGDPLFYGSFMYLQDRLAPRFRVEIVPGVTSVHAAAAAAGRALCRRNAPLATLPAPLDDAALEARLAPLLRDGAGVALMKLGRHAGRVRALLTRLGLAARAVYVEEASAPEARLTALADAPDLAPYFSMILVFGADDRENASTDGPAADPETDPETAAERAS